MLVSLSSTTPWPLLPVVSPAGLVVSVPSTEQPELYNDDEKDDIPRMVEWTNKHNHHHNDQDAQSEVSSLASTGSVVPTTRVVLTHKEQYQRLYAIAPRQPSKLPHPAALLPPPGPFCRADLAPYPWPPRPIAVAAQQQDETNGPQTSLVIAKESGSSSSRMMEYEDSELKAMVEPSLPSLPARRVSLETATKEDETLPQSLLPGLSPAGAAAMLCKVKDDEGTTTSHSVMGARTTSVTPCTTVATKNMPSAAGTRGVVPRQFLTDETDHDDPSCSMIHHASSLLPTTTSSKTQSTTTTVPTTTTTTTSGRCTHRRRGARGWHMARLLLCTTSTHNHKQEPEPNSANSASPTVEHDPEHQPRTQDPPGPCRSTMSRWEHQEPPPSPQRHETRRHVVPNTVEPRNGVSSSGSSSSSSSCLSVEVGTDGLEVVVPSLSPNTPKDCASNSVLLPHDPPHQPPPPPPPPHVSPLIQGNETDTTAGVESSRVESETLISSTALETHHRHHPTKEDPLWLANCNGLAEEALQCLVHTCVSSS